MPFWRKLLAARKPPSSKAETDSQPTSTPQEAVADVPWQWSTRDTRGNGGELFENLRQSLPPIFAAIDKPGRDPVFVLADVAGEARWKRLIYLLFKYGKVYYSPEALCGLNPQYETISGEPLYKAPTIHGTQLKVGIYAVERESLVSELCAIVGVPPPMIKQVKREGPKGMFTVLYFCGLTLGVRYVSPDAKKDEPPPADSFY